MALWNKFINTLEKGAWGFSGADFEMTTADQPDRPARPNCPPGRRASMEAKLTQL